MNSYEAIFLGVLQGVTEFLPVSSSGHLVLAEYFLGLKETPLAFDVILHLGTLVSVLAFFFKDWLRLLLSLNPTSRDKDSKRLFIYLVIGTIPGALFGFLFEKVAETYLRSPWVVVVTLSSVAILLFLAERFARHVRNLSSLTLKDSFLVGISQALAIIPGVSRSGITMTCGLFLGLNRSSSAKFSFLLSAPIIAGAGLYEGLKIIKSGGQGVDINYFVGFLASLISGYLVIAFLMNYLKKNTFYPFVVYRLILALTVATVLFIS